MEPTEDRSRSSLLAEFINVTGAEQERAQFYLDSSAWKLEVALASFFDGDDDQPEPEPEPSRAVPQRKAPAPKFATISGMKQAEKKPDDTQGQEYYAGGSRESGEVIIGPPRKKANASKFVEDMFKAAKEHGAEEVAPGTSDAQDSSAAFVGSGYILGESEEAPSQKVQGKTAPPKQVSVILKLWKNGFSVDDGPLREYNNPENKEFLDSIHKGSIPNELRALARGGEVNLDMEDHRDDEYVAPKVALRAFTGEGHMLGSPAPSLVSSASPALKEKHENMAKSGVVVDPSKPTTQLQIRLADGSRLVHKFNHTHTVFDVRNFIITARPAYGASSFTLMTTFPNKVITNEDLTLADAQLLNAVIVQKMK